MIAIEKSSKIPVTTAMSVYVNRCLILLPEVSFLELIGGSYGVIVRICSLKAFRVCFILLIVIFISHGSFAKGFQAKKHFIINDFPNKKHPFNILEKLIV
jgi:hypothetical protein